MDFSKNIEESVCRLTCGSETATAFLISKDMVITASHCVSEFELNNEPIVLEFININETIIKINAMPVDNLKLGYSKPVAVLRLQYPIEIDFAKFTNYEIKRKDRWEAYGYPNSSKITVGDWVEGFISRKIDKYNPFNWNIDLKLDDGRISDYSGLSGAPLIVDQKVVGVILTQATQHDKAISIGAIGVQKFIDILDNLDILVLNDNSSYFERTDHERNLKVNIVNIASRQIGGFDNSLNITTLDENHYRKQLGRIYEQQLDELISLRINGDIDGAWDELRNTIKDFEIGDTLKKISSRYYYMAAQWTLSDYQNLDEANRYYNLAISLDNELDTRTFRAKVLAIEGNYKDALFLLNPLDKENILNTALYILLVSGQGNKAEEILSQATVKPTHSSRHMLALCNIQAQNYLMAEHNIQKAITHYPKSPIYHLVAGLIDYWQGMPIDVIETGDIMPIFLNTKIFVPDEQQTDNFIKAIRHYQDAKQYADYHKNVNILCEILQAWLLTLSMLPDSRIEANNIMEELLEIDPDNSIALLYAAENYENIESDILSRLEKLTQEQNANLNLVSALIRIYLKTENDQAAIITLEKFKNEFSINNALELWIHLMIEAYLIVNNFENALKLLDETVEVDEYVRSRIKGYILERQGKNDELLDLSISLVKNQGTRIDYANLALVYKKLGYWENVIEIADTWYEKYSDSYALEQKAEAQLNLNMAEDCLETIEKLRMGLPNNALTEQGQWYKLHALRMLSKIDEAILIAKDIWEKKKNERIVLLRARLSISIGDNSGAVGILREGISLGYANVEIYMMLAELIKTSHPQEAFDFSQKAVELSRNSEQVLLWSIIIGFDTGNDYEASKLLIQFQEKFPSSELLHRYSSTELVPMITEWNNKSEKIWKYYADGQIPLHLVIENQNKVMGFEFYCKWVYNSHISYKLQLPIMLAFGGRSENQDLKIFKQGEIFMDYSACLVAHELDLFSILKRVFPRITISSHLFILISMEIDKIRTVQPKILVNRKDLLELKQSLQLKTIELPEINVKEFQIEDQDYKVYCAAKHHNAFFIEDSFATEILFGRDVPEEVKCLQVYTQEVLSALVQRGLISKKTVAPLIDGKEIRQDVVENLVRNKPPLLVDLVFLERINELGCMEMVADICDLLIFEDAFKSIEAELRAYERQEQAAKWLEKLNERLIQLRREGVIVLSPNIDYEDTEKDSGLLRIIKDMLHSKQLIWCDDRNINSYSKSEYAQIIGIFDVLEYLRENQFISTEVYMSKVSTLFRSGVKFYIPPQVYLEMCLNIAEPEPETILLRETSSLRDIRHSIISSLSEKSVIGKNKLAHVRFPELTGYLINLNRLLDSCMLYVWSTQGKDDKWREAAATWLILNCSDFASDITHLTANTGQIKNLIASKHSLLICMGLRMGLTFTNASISAAYLKWLFTWLEKYWLYNPDIRDLTIKSVVDFICDIADNALRAEACERAKKVGLYFVSKLLRNLPDAFREDLERHPNIKELFGIIHTNVIIINGLPNIPEDLWERWVNNALNRGASKKGIENFDNYNIEVTFCEGSLLLQSIMLEWEDVNGKKQLVNILEPYAQLNNEDSHIRVSWLDLAKDYICLHQNIEYYREGLKAQDYARFAEELKVDLDNSPEFFFNRLEILIKNDHQKLPEEKDLFPHKPQVFINELSLMPRLDDIHGELWLSYFYGCIERDSVEKALSLFSALPLGEMWSFGNILDKAIENGKIDLAFLLEWCCENLLTTANPIRQQNLLAFLLKRGNSLDNRYWDLIGETFITLLEANDYNEEVNSNHNLFITLLKISWQYVDSLNEYELYGQEQRVLWSYIYADKIHTICNDLINSEEFPYDIKVVCKTFMSFLSKLNDNDRDIFRNSNKPILEVAIPSMASICRIVFGSTLAIIEENPDNLESIKEILIPIVNKLILTNMVRINGAEELLLGFDNVDNYFNTYFDKNVLIRIRNIMTNWGIEAVEDFNYIAFYKNILDNMLRVNELGEEQLLYLVALARQPFPDELVPIIKDVLERNDLLPTVLTDDLLKTQGEMIYAIIHGLPKKDMDYFLQMLKNDLKNIFVKYPNRYKIFIELLITFCSTDNLNEASENFMSVLEEVLLVEPKIEINAKFGAFLSGMVWWLPAQFTERIHRLRRSVIW